MRGISAAANKPLSATGVGTVGSPKSPPVPRIPEPGVVGVSDGSAKIEERREELEELAESDNPAGWVAEALLEAAEEKSGQGQP